MVKWLDTLRWQYILHSMCPWQDLPTSKLFVVPPYNIQCLIQKQHYDHVALVSTKTSWYCIMCFCISFEIVIQFVPVWMYSTADGNHLTQDVNWVHGARVGGDCTISFKQLKYFLETCILRMSVFCIKNTPFPGCDWLFSIILLLFSVLTTHMFVEGISYELIWRLGHEGISCWEIL